MVIIIKYLRNAIVTAFGLIIFGLIFSFVPVSYYRLQPTDPTKEETNLYSLAVNVKESTVSDFILSVFDSSDDFIKKTDSTAETLDFENQLIQYYYSDQLAAEQAYKLSNLNYETQFYGIRITNIEENSDYYNYLKVGDIICEINGQKIKDNPEIIKSVDKRNIHLKIIRNGHYDDLQFTVDNGDQTFSYISYSKIKSEKELELKSETIIDYGSSASLVNFINYYKELNNFKISKPLALTGGLVYTNNNIEIEPVSGIKQKLISAANNDIQYLVVSKDNFDEALKTKQDFNLKNITIIKANSLETLIEQLLIHEILEKD